MSRPPSDPRHRYALPGEEPFRRLLKATLVLHEQSERLARLNALAEPLRRNGLVKLPGELALLDVLRSLHQEARALLHAMNESKSDAGPHLVTLERKLSSVEWELAPELEEALERKTARLRALVEGYQQGRNEASSALDELRHVIAEAGQFMAPVEHEMARWRELDDLRRSVDRALRDAQFEDALGPLAGLQSYRQREHQGALKAVREKQTAARAICRQADLLFLRSPRDGRQRYRYTVLLRTPVETGSQGVNIQASTTLVEQDRQDILDAVKEFTGHLGGEFARRGASRDVVPLAPLRDGRPVASIVRDVGELMYRLFMPEEMQRYVDETRCSLTVTTNDLELPWELMFQRDGAHGSPGARRDEFLCVSRPVARLPMGHAFPRRDRGLPARRDRLRFLLIHSNPGGGLPDLPGAVHEVQAVHDELRRGWGDRIHVEMLDAGDVTGKTLNRILREGAFDVIHYAGHAYADDEQGDLSGLVLKGGEIFFAQKVRRLLEGCPLVFLNACQSGAVGGVPADKLGAYAQAEGLASAFLYGGAVACIGSLWPIYDVPAAAFATAFYRYVLEGNMIGEAMRLARCDVRRDHQGDATWAAFVLYGNPTYRHTLG